jgi:type I site-specific restriction endonuclease
MVQTAVTPVIRSLEDIEKIFGASRSIDRTLFPEWRTDLPILSETEVPALDLLRDRFRYQRKMGPVAEGAVNAIVISPLLALAGFYDAPFQLRSEASVTITVTIVTDDDVNDDADECSSETLRGRMDFLVLHHQFWQVVIESKETTFDIEMGIPQALAYMMAAPARQRILFGMVTNGNHFMFIKLQRSPKIEYSFSNTFSMLSDQNQLQDVLQILKRIGSIVALT